MQLILHQPQQLVVNGGGGAFFNAPQVIGGDTINNRSQTIKLIGDPDPFISKGLLSVGGFSTP